MNRRRSIVIEGFTHRSPIPAASQIGPLLVSSLLTGASPESGEIPESVEDEIRHIFGHVARILDSAGATWSDVVEMTFAMEDAIGRAHINPIWLEYFPDPDDRPAREVQQRGGLPAGSRITCRITAYVQ